MADFADARRIIQSGIETRAFPAATIEVGRRGGPIWQEAFGRLTYDADAPACEVDTIFDLASLTKVISTTSIAMRLVGLGRVTLESPVGAFVPAFATGDRAAISIRHLLTHSSGLPAHARLWETVSGRDGFTRAIASLPLEHAPGAKSVYSDPGFMLLGFVLETAANATLEPFAFPRREEPDKDRETLGGIQQPARHRRTRTALDDQFQPLAAEIGEIWFNPRPGLIDRIAPTEQDPWRGRLLRGEVHDENAAALGGVAAHAGLFGTAPAVGAFARLILRTFQEQTSLGTPDLVRRFATRSAVPDSSRALGWDTMLPTSSCGTRLSPTAIGHTGFTGTSLWIDRENDLYVVFLTNRVHPTRANEQHVALRPAVHDAVVEDLER